MRRDVMVATVPFVAFGLARFLFLMRQRDVGEEPDRFCRPTPILISVVLGALVAATAPNVSSQ
jgi:hypothetical protein